MHRTPRIAAFAFAALGAASASAGGLPLAFVQPERYTDATYSNWRGSERERAAVQRDLEQHLRRLAERGLAPGRTLAIDVLDIDLAGHFEPWRFRGSDVRILREVTWPRIELRYTLSDGERVIASGDERLSGLNYLSSSNLYFSSERLRYEKAMLDEWFERRIAGR